MAEKVERGAHFLIVVTEVDLAAARQSFVIALPSVLTNVAVLSVKRLKEASRTTAFSTARQSRSTDDQGTQDRSSEDRITEDRLATLILHTLGHLLELKHDPAPGNLMYDFDAVEELDRMEGWTPAQVNQLRANLPREARDTVGPSDSKAFVARQVVQNAGRILRGVRRSNPVDLAIHLPTMITAALSLNIVLFFSSEIWDVASTASLIEVTVFSLIAVGTATVVLYRAFALPTVTTRGGKLAESVVVTAATTIVSLASAVVVLYVVFLVVVYVAAQTVFPRTLMTTWPTAGEAVTVLDHVRLGMFLAAMGVLGGSLGGRADQKRVIQHILFLDEEA